MFYQHLLYLKKCTLLFTPSPGVRLYACENVDNGEQPSLLSAFPHRQFHTLPGLLDSWAALPNSNPNACMPMQGGSLSHFYDGLWYDRAERRTHDLPCERRTRYRLSQPDTVVNSNAIKLFKIGQWDAGLILCQK